ncbi:MAG TPA: glycosyltransferase [Gaiellaceae bacterium]|nr:glycosyltransferase [Gaiellaceae bacterium]
MRRLLRPLRAVHRRVVPREPRRTAWPAARERAPGEPANVGIAVVNFNTKRLISQLVFSLYRLLGPAWFRQIVVVDNASTDGSRDVLAALHDAGLVHLIANRSQRYHGPALTQGVSWLARRQRSVPPRDRLDYVWTLDSDVVVLRRETARDALSVIESTDAAAVAQLDFLPADENPLSRNPLLHPCCFLFDPTVLWRPAIPPFLEDGRPLDGMQVTAEKLELRMVAFPFVEHGYIVHLGRGTLRAVADLGDTQNRYYEWAVGHKDPHFAASASGPELYAAFCERFDAELPELTGEALVAACRAPVDD